MSFGMPFSNAAAQGGLARGFRWQIQGVNHGAAVEDLKNLDARGSGNIGMFLLKKCMLA